MQGVSSSETLAQPFWPVKSTESISIGSTDPSMIHHKVNLSKGNKRIVSYSMDGYKPYGVSSSRKILTKGLLFKKWDTIRAFLRGVCNLTTKEVEVAQVLLRLQAYYPQVYPKAAQVAAEAHVGIATFWRTVSKLRDMNLLEVVNQFVIRVEAQISNLYLLNKLLIAIARYLAEHGVRFLEKWLTPALTMPGRQFWSQIWQSPGDLVAPGDGAF